MRASPQTNPQDGTGQKSEPEIKLWDGPTRSALCRPKRERTKMDRTNLLCHLIVLRSEKDR